MPKVKYTEIGLLFTLKPLASPEPPSAYESGAWAKGESEREVLALHDNVNCALNEPCVRPIRGTNLRNIIIVLRHEELHHTFLRIGEDEANDCLDQLIPTVELTCWRLGCTNHQVKQ